MFISSITLLFIIILLLTRSLPLKTIVLVLRFESFIPFLEVTIPRFCIEVYCASSESITITWSSAQKCLNIYISRNFDTLYHHFFAFSNNLTYKYVK